MNDKILNLINALNDNILNIDFVDISYNIIEDLSMQEKPQQALEPLMLLIENNPETDFGCPGPIIHFLEKFYKKGYEEILIKSIQRKPNIYTIWMLNRIINGCSGDEKEKLIKILKDVYYNKNTSIKVVDFIAELNLIKI